MVVKLFYILLLQVYFCKAYVQYNNGPGPAQGLPYQPVALGNAYLGNVKKTVDCRTLQNSPDSKSSSVYSQKNVPLDDDRKLVSQSLKDESQSRNPLVEYVPKKTLYVYDDDSDEAVAKNEQENALEKPPRESESLELRKIVENCLTAKLRLPKKQGLVYSEELLNTRRRNSNDSYVEGDNSLENADYRNVDSDSSNLEEQLLDPTQAVGLRRLTSPNSNLLMMQNKRVCYACTSANNPSCWAPNRYTTVKYCRREHNACVTKTYKSGSELVVIRDCATSCSSRAGIEPEYKSCSICKSDLCNDTSGASILRTFNFHSLIFGVILISFFKRAF